MRRTIILILTAGLLVLWLFDLLVPGVAGSPLQDASFTLTKAWITWLDLLAFFAGCFALGPVVMRAKAWTGFLALLLLGLGIAGAVGKAPTWMGGWNLLFAICFAAVFFASPWLGPARTTLAEEELPKDQVA